jgi:DNA modification methylase
MILSETRWPADAVERRAVETLIPYARNARKHSDAQVAEIAGSIREWGWTIPALIDEDGRIIAGHGRVLAASKLGIADIPVMVARGWSDAQKQAYTLADNQIALHGTWDLNLLRVELADLQRQAVDLATLGFAADDLARIIGPKVGLTDPDDVPETPVEAVTRQGDLWLLGAHRLLCGDSTHVEDIARAIENTKAHMVFTDPPYGVGYNGGMKRRERLAADDLGTGIYAASLVHLQFAADDNAPLYLWYADAHAAAAAAAAAAAGYQIVAQIIWAKNHAQFMTSAHYKGKHEPCFYAHRRGYAARWHGPNNEVTLWECDRSPRNDYHPTQKPVELAQRALRNSTESGGRVLDLFAGSGSTIIAAEITGRACHALEISPAYCDVIVKRWQMFTGQQATRECDGRAFDDVKLPKRIKRASLEGHGEASHR